MKLNQNINSIRVGWSVIKGKRSITSINFHNGSCSEFYPSLIIFYDQYTYWELYSDKCIYNMYLK